jgi:hypothetical protein
MPQKATALSIAVIMTVGMAVLCSFLFFKKSWVSNTAVKSAGKPNRTLLQIRLMP